MDKLQTTSSQWTSANSTHSRYSRRQFIVAAATIGAAMLPAANYASPLIIPTPTTAANETYTGDKHGLTVTWNPDSWQLKFEPVPGTDNITLVDTDADIHNVHADQYYFQVGYLSRDRWPTVDAVQQNAIDDWFDLGMLNATIIQEWATPDAYGFFYTSEVQNKQGLYYIEFSAFDLPNMIWRWIAIEISSAIYDAARTTSLFAGITVDNEPVPRATDLETLVNLFDQNVVR